LSKDAAGLDEAGRVRLRKQALAWLEAELALWKKTAAKSEGKVAPVLRAWLEDDDLAGVRGRPVLEKLPEEERRAWQELWAGVRELARLK
jgi:hypothetical protein